MRARLLILLVALIALALPATAGAGRIAGEGKPDRSFSGDGRVLTDLDEGSKDKANAVIAYGDRILLAGYSTQHPFGVQLALAAYRQDGSLDPGFGDGGIVLSNVEDGMAAEAMAIDSFGDIVVAGPSNTGQPFGSPSVARLLPDGRLDTSFAGSGYKILPVRESGSYASAGALDVKGRVILAGKTGTLLGFAALGESGQLDRSFGRRGFALHDVRDEYLPGDVADDSHRRVVGALESIGSPSTPPMGAFRAWRLRADGSFDRRFSGDGRVAVPLGGRLGTARSVALQGNGRILLGGWAKLPGTIDTDFALVRLRGGL